MLVNPEERNERLLFLHILEEVRLAFTLYARASSVFTSLIARHQFEVNIVCVKFNWLIYYDHIFFRFNEYFVY